MVVQLAKNKLDRPRVRIVSNCRVGTCTNGGYQALSFSHALSMGTTLFSKGAFTFSMCYCRDVCIYT